LHQGINYKIPATVKILNKWARRTPFIIIFVIDKSTELKTEILQIKKFLKDIYFCHYIKAIPKV